MRNPYTNEKLFEDLFGFRREFNEMFNRILTGKPWGLELPEFKKTFNITPAVEAYVDKEAKMYVCHVTLPGMEPKELQIHAQANMRAAGGCEHREADRRVCERRVGDHGARRRGCLAA
jgi:HSP20 family molecular chaperone IbpA